MHDQVNSYNKPGSVCLVRVYKHCPLSTSQSLTVESNDAEARTNGKLGLFVFGPVGDHLIV